MVRDAALLNTQHYKVRIKGKVEQSREWSSVVWSYANSCRMNHNNTTIKTQKDFFINILTSHFIVRFEKSYPRFACEKELETEQKLQYFDSHSYGHQRCVFLVLLMLNRRPRGPLCWVMAFFTTSYQQLLWISTHQGPKAPSAWCGFPYHNSSITPTPARTGTGTLTSVLTELYNSSMPTQSPTWSLEWHDWSSSSGNNCHAVHRSFSSGASVYECIMGIFFYLVPFHQPISAHAIFSHNCH